jgi:hypothetical protein
LFCWELAESLPYGTPTLQKISQKNVYLDHGRNDRITWTEPYVGTQN